MVIFSFGLPKSGSTLAFQLASCIARFGGHPQSLLPPPLSKAGHYINFHDVLDADILRRVVEHAGGRHVIIKTHSIPGPAWVEEYKRLAAQGQVAAHVNHRDPRDICLALLDAGRRSRAQGKREFSEFTTLEEAAERVEWQLRQLESWTSLPNVLNLRYEICAFRMDEAIDQLKAHLGVRTPNWLVRLVVRHFTFTQFNKGVPERHRSELSPIDATWLAKTFAPYLDAMGYSRC